jgi:hypothetical protein
MTSIRWNRAKIAVDLEPRKHAASAKRRDVMIRITEQQARLLFGRKATKVNGGGEPEQKVRRPRLRKRREDLPENQAVRQIRDFLAVRGWLTIRQQVGTFRTMDAAGTFRFIRVGEKGAADWSAVLPARGEHRTAAHFFFFEVKARGKKPSTDQLFWMEKVRAMGFMADWFDGLSDGTRPFAPWYAGVFGVS